MGLTNSTYDLFISDNISNLTKPRIKTIYPKFKTKDYIPNLVLNQVFTNRFPNDKYPIIFAIIRKVKYLNQLYNSFALSLKKIDSAKPRINEYFDIIFKGEAILLFLGQIIDLINCLNESKLFEKEDNSIWQRAYSLHNDIKHEKTELIKEKKLQVIQIDNDGIYNSNTNLNYEELRKILILLNKEINEILTLK